MNPKDIVAHGYDRIAERYLAWSGTVRDDARDRYTSVLLDRLPPGATILDLGCGAGIPTTKRLAERFVVTGVDISARQVDLAAQNVPDAVFIQADVTALDFPPESFDGVAAFYSLTHVPREEQGPLLRSIAAWLRPGGILAASLGVRDSPGAVEEDWLGVPMYFSGYDARTSTHIVEQAGLEIVSAREETIDEDGAPVPFLWVVAQKPEQKTAGTFIAEPL